MNTENNVISDDVVITKEDIARAIKSIAYRKAYNSRPEVQAKRKVYNQKKALVMRKAIEMLKQREGGRV
jgi:hypothetical protein